MRKNLLAIGLLAISFSATGQSYLTYVGEKAEVYVNDGALVYSGGGWKVASSSATSFGKVKNHGDIMIVKDANSASAVTFDANADFTLVFGMKSASAAGDKSTYGQLYIKDIPQASITGKVNKEFTADVNHSATAKQQTALPFHKFGTADLVDALGSYFNFTNTALTGSGRFAYNSVFKWNNIASRFDQITTTAAGVGMGKPTDYFIIPRRDASGATVWDAANVLKTFKGTPASDSDTYSTAAFPVTIADSRSYGEGLGFNYYRERYNTYLNDPFEKNSDGSANWKSTTYAKNLSQFANPFLTNLDLFNIASADGTDADGDGNAITNIFGVAYYDKGTSVTGSTYEIGTGTTYSNGNLVMSLTTGGLFQSGDVSKLFIKPMQEIAMKFTNNNAVTLNLNGMRTFSQSYRAANAKSVTSKSVSSSNIPSDMLVKQVAVVAYDAANNELGRTYYAVSPSSVTGITGKTQAINDNGVITTSEEVAAGGADANAPYPLYINEANEVDYFGKEIPMKLSSANAVKFGFEVYEGGRKISQLSNGNSFYIMKDNVVTKISNGGTMPATLGNYGLYYGNPTGKNLSSNVLGATKAQTVIAKKDNDWVVRFAESWKSASVEVYSAAGQLLHSAKNVSTVTDYVVPFNSRSNGLYIIKTISETGEVVTKKIVK